MPTLTAKNPMNSKNKKSPFVTFPSLCKPTPKLSKHYSLPFTGDLPGTRGLTGDGGLGALKE